MRTPARRAKRQPRPPQRRLTSGWPPCGQRWTKARLPGPRGARPWAEAANLAVLDWGTLAAGRRTAFSVLRWVRTRSRAGAVPLATEPGLARLWHQPLASESARADLKHARALLGGQQLTRGTPAGDLSLYRDLLRKAHGDEQVRRPKQKLLRYYRAVPLPPEPLVVGAQLALRWLSDIGASAPRGIQAERALPPGVDRAVLRSKLYGCGSRACGGGCGLLRLGPAAAADRSALPQGRPCAQRTWTRRLWRPALPMSSSARSH
jgi:hypothetical protein